MQYTSFGGYSWEPLGGLGCQSWTQAHVPFELQITHSKLFHIRKGADMHHLQETQDSGEILTNLHFA